MKILLLSYYEYAPDPNTGGIGTYTRNLAHGLVELGHEVHVLIQDLETDFAEEEKKGIMIHRCEGTRAQPAKPPPRSIPKRALGKAMRIRSKIWFLIAGGLAGPYSLLKNSYRVRNKTLEIVKKYGIDVIEAPECSGQGFFIRNLSNVVRIVKFHTPIHFIAHHNKEMEAGGFGLRLATRIEAAVARTATACTSPSSFMAKEASALFGLHRKIHVIPNGINIGEVDSISPVDIEKEYGIQSGQKTVLYVGSMQPRKVDVFVDVVPRVLAREEDTVFVFLGRDDFGFETRLRKELADRNLPDKVLFVGRQPYKRVIGMLKSVDLFVHPPVFENFPYTCMEAMVCRKPVVSTRVGGIPEMIEDGKSGLLVEYGDDSALAEAILSFLTSETMRVDFGNAARERVDKLYDHRQVAMETLELYKAYRSPLAPVRKEH